MTALCFFILHLWHGFLGWVPPIRCTENREDPPMVVAGIRPHCRSGRRATPVSVQSSLALRCIFDLPEIQTQTCQTYFSTLVQSVKHWFRCNTTKRKDRQLIQGYEDDVIAISNWAQFVILDLPAGLGNASSGLQGCLQLVNQTVLVAACGSLISALFILCPTTHLSSAESHP